MLRGRKQIQHLQLQLKHNFYKYHHQSTDSPSQILLISPEMHSNLTLLWPLAGQRVSDTTAS